MRLPAATTSADVFLQTFGVYHLTRLEADKAMKDLAEAFAKAQARLKARVEAFDAAHMSTMRAQAVRDGEDDAFDNAVRGFALAILAKVGNSTRAPLYKKYFGDGLRGVIGAPLEEELQRAGVLLGLLAEEEDESLRPYAGTIRSALDALSGAMDAHRAAMDSEAQAWGLLETEKVNWLDAYKRSYRDLTRIFFKDPKRADSYFKPAKADKKQAAPPAGPAAPPKV
jgi:hypothetical protein